MKWHKFPDDKPLKFALLLISWVAALAVGKKFYRYELAYYSGEAFFNNGDGKTYEILSPNKGQVVYWVEIEEPI